jgi:hypothetical protein
MLVLTRRAMRASAVAPILALALAGAPARAAALYAFAPPDGEDPLAAAKAAHARAQAEYETAAYDRAIESWTQAYAALPDTADSATYRPLILYNIARAREKLFEIRGDVSHLRQALDLLVKFEAAIPEVYADEPAEGEAERTRVRERIADLEQKIEKAERGAVPATSPEPQPEPQPAEPRPQPQPDAPSSSTRPLIAVGSVLLVLGVAGFAGMGAGLAVGERANDIDDLPDDALAEREDRFDRGRRANAAAIALGVISPLLLGAGVALVVVGAKRKSKTSAVAPLVSPTLVGVSLSGRF